MVLPDYSVKIEWRQFGVYMLGEFVSTVSIHHISTLERRGAIFGKSCQRITLGDLVSRNIVFVSCILYVSYVDIIVSSPALKTFARSVCF